MPFFSKVFKSRDGTPVNAKRREEQHMNGQLAAPPRKRYVSSWSSSEIVPEEVEELIHSCTVEMKSRAEALDTPFLLLPFRPDSDPHSSRTFIRNFFKANMEGLNDFRGEMLQQELRLTEPEVLCSIIKWCWSRMPGGVVTWNVYELFRMGEQDSEMSSDAFDTFIPLSVDSVSRKNIIYDFFDLLATIAARGKANGLGGRKLSRMAGWWAFEHSDNGNGFDGGYKSWKEGADASSHLFFAYLRSLDPEAVNGISGISALPRSLQALVAQTEYPPQTPTLMQTSTSRVVMIVDSVSPTPFALLRRAKHFEYRDDDRVLQLYSDYADPLQALTEECKRVLNCIASTNESAVARSRRSNFNSAQLMNGLAVRSDESWAHFENMGFSAISTGASTRSSSGEFSTSAKSSPRLGGIQSNARSKIVPGGRPTTPSWADFLNSGFADDGADAGTKRTLILPPDKVLPPLGSEPNRKDSSVGGIDDDEDLEPGELANIVRFDLDDSFWWVWMTSLASEEPAQRKAVFGRCALIETSIKGGRWLAMEEQVKGASPGPEEGAYIVEKKSRFGFSRKGRSTKKKAASRLSIQESVEPVSRAETTTPNKASITPEQQSKIQAAAAVLAQKQNHLDVGQIAERRGRHADAISNKTNSVMTVGLSNEAGPAMKWANAFDKEAVRKQYLGDNFAGRGMSREFLASNTSSVNYEGKEPMLALQRSITPSAQRMDQALPPRPTETERQTPNEPTAGAPFAPLPKGPVVNVQQPADETNTASEVPLPMATPNEPAAVAEAQSISPNATRVGRKPISPTGAANVHPAYRSRAAEMQISSPESSGAQIAARAAWQSRDELAETGSPSRDAKKLQKKSGPGTLKKLFGKKPQEPAQGRLEKSDTTASLQPPSESGVGRKLSHLKRKPSPTPLEPAQTPAESVAMSPDPPMTPEGPMSPDMARIGSTVPEHLLPEDAWHVPRAHEYPQSEMASISRIDSQDQIDAEHSFSRFDQGPLTDEPAFVPGEYEDDDDDVTPSIPRNARKEGDYLNPHGPETQGQSVYATPLETEAGDDTETTSMASGNIQPPTTKSAPAPAEAGDRWAQIRRNAAERAAAASEEQSQNRPSQSQSRLTDQTDDGETSGEETIEDRVARIKARVAELTGNARR